MELSIQYADTIVIDTPNHTTNTIEWRESRNSQTKFLFLFIQLNKKQKTYLTEYWMSWAVYFHLYRWIWIRCLQYIFNLSRVNGLLFVHISSCIITLQQRIHLVKSPLFQLQRLPQQETIQKNRSSDQYAICRDMQLQSRCDFFFFYQF